MRSISKKLMELGWKLRERKRPILSFIFLKLSSFGFLAKEDYFNFTESLCHLAYLFRLVGIWFSKVAFEYAEAALIYAEEKETKTVHAYRALASTAIAAGDFELAEYYLLLYHKVQKQPADKADVASQYALVKLRNGKRYEAYVHSSEALTNLRELYEESQSKQLAIWLCGALMRHAIICAGFIEKKERIHEGKMRLDYMCQIAQTHDLLIQLDQHKKVVSIYEMLNL